MKLQNVEDMKKILLLMISLSFLFLSCSKNEDSPPIHPLIISISYKNGEGVNLLHQWGLMDAEKAVNLTKRTDLVEVEVKDSSSVSREADVYYIPTFGFLDIKWGDMEIFNQYNKKHNRKYCIKIKMPLIYGDDEFHTIETVWEVEGYETIPIQVTHQGETIDFVNTSNTASIKIVL